MPSLDSILAHPLPQAQRAQLRRAALQCRAAFARVGNRCLELLMTWQQRASARATLAAMNERERRDIGLSRRSVLVEADKPFWRA
jgi:uncharacterized protein YjiS (DUF1127 family)